MSPTLRPAPRVSLRNLIGLLAASALGAGAQTIDFNAHIRPILNQSCTSCHGGVKAAGDISFVYRETATKVGKKSGKPVIVPGDPDASEMIARITSADKDYRMPPAEHGPALSADKIALLREWIRQGAPWQEHWAFVPPVPQAVPRIENPKSKIENPIDAFVLARLEKEKLAPSPEADRAALLRRVSLDLVGLPPSPAEIVAFVADRAPHAYERQVDRLLASPHFGERWASLWLDLARYADTKGYEKDDHRTVWPYRDWLVDAFNRNLPYDRFVVEQLAGDLLPGAGLGPQVATAFHRQTQVNDEGGTDDEEYRIAAVLDRIGTTWQVTSAVTFGCVQCHSHPYDPIKHEEFYRFFAVFNNTRDADLNNEHPVLRVPADAARADDAWRLRREIDALRHAVVAAGQTLERERAQWRPLAVAEARGVPAVAMTREGDVFAVDGTVAVSARYELDVPAAAWGAQPISALRFEATPVDAEKSRHTPERGFIITQIKVEIVAADGTATPVEVGRFFPDTENFTTVTRRMPEKPEVPAPTPAVAVAGAGESVPAKKEKKGRQAKEAEAAAAAATEARDVTLDFYFAANPTISGPRWGVAALREPIVAPADSTVRLTLVHGRGITEKPAPIRRLRVQTSADPRWHALGSDAELARKSERVGEALLELAKLPGTELPVMRELAAAERRETRLFLRGNFLDKVGPPLAPGVPELFPPLPAGRPADRLAVAEWFFQPGQPLTARVAVNRFWEQLFGAGIVTTLEDFGSVGETPSHPELLDWLALRFERDLKWDMKALLREIVTSATYRQDARVTPEALERDPRNRLLGRGPRQRLTAEMVRDQALAASGLLSRKLGGPPVMPPQPEGVWQTVYNSKNWVESTGEDRHRRALYTFWKRSAAYPGFLTFDMPARDLCTARRTPTNTPLQALVTLNDTVYHEAAAALAARARQETAAADDTAAQIAHAFTAVISRPPTAIEGGRLLKLFDDSRAAGTADPLATVASAILNLDAAFVR